MPPPMKDDMTTLGSQPVAGGTRKYFTGSALVTDTPQLATPTAGLETIEYAGDKAHDLVTEDENSKMQICWNKAMCDEMKLPQGYQNIAVLIIKWAKEIDQLKSESEVEDVRKVFAEDFNYPTTIIELNNKTRPQLQLDRQVINFVADNNGDYNLLIVYYSGHGSYDEKTEEFLLHASDDRYTTPLGTHPTQAVWNNAERSLVEHADCDMLAIFDACYASNIHKAVQKQDPRTYELLTATGHDKTTAGPGRRSFTAALVKSLRALREECGENPFTTHQLCEKINLHTERRKDQSHLWNRFKRFDRTIALAPLKKSLSERKQEFSQEETRSLLTLTLPLTVARLSNDQIQELARSLSKAVKDIKAPVKRLDWRKLRSSGRTTNFANLTRTRGIAKRWLSIHQSRKSQSPAPMRDQPSQTIDDIHETADDSCQTVEPDAKPMKRKETTEMDDTPVSPLKRSRTNDEMVQTPANPHYHPPTPPETMEVD